MGGARHDQYKCEDAWGGSVVMRCDGYKVNSDTAIRILVHWLFVIILPEEEIIYEKSTEWYLNEPLADNKPRTTLFSESPTFGVMQEKCDK